MKVFAVLLTITALIACSAPQQNYGVSSRVRPLTQKQAGRLISGAKDHLGEPYKYGGTTPRGWDCSGFTSGMYSIYLSYHLPRSSESLFSQSVKVPSKKRKPGDLVFFKIESKGYHVGIYIGRGKFIHASTSSGVIISSLKEEYYRDKFVGFRRPLLALGD